MDALTDADPPSSRSVDELVRRAQRGDHRAFGELVAQYEEMVRAVCRQRLRDHADVQEVVQDVFIKAYQKLGQLREPAALCGWLKAIAHRQALNRIGRRTPTIDLANASAELCDEAESPPLATMIQQERIDQLHAGLNRLATLDRSTLEAFYLRGQSLVEMSDAFAAPVGTIKRRLHTARQRLARELECLQAV
jgi:RNA polymerase sigma-70 factor (ECF subfamily)